MWKAERATKPGCRCPCIVGAFADFGKMSEENDQRHEQKNAADEQVRRLHHVGFGGAIADQLRGSHGGEFGRCVLDARENESGSKKSDQHGSSGIERLSEVEAALGTLLGTECGHVGIRGDFENGLATSHHEKREEKESINLNRSGRDKQCCARGTDQQANQDAALVAETLHEPTGGKSGEEVSAEECGLNPGRLEIAETECFAEMLDQNVIDIDADGPEKEQARDQRQRHDVAAFSNGG